MGTTLRPFNLNRFPLRTTRNQGIRNIMQDSKTVLILYLNLIHKEAAEREAVKSSSNLLSEILSLGGWIKAENNNIQDFHAMSTM